MTEQCPCCESGETVPFLSGNYDPGRAISRSFTLFLCKRCRLRFQRIAAIEAQHLYADLEDVADRRPGMPAERRQLHNGADVLRAFRRFHDGKTVLDIGSGDGWFLEAANREGYNCLGVDVSERLAITARRRSGVCVLVGDLHALNLAPESFDLVNLDLVLMYVAEPRRLMLRISQLLRPGGICRIREYDVDSIVARRAGPNYWLYGPTRVCSWTRRSIQALADATGFRVRHVFPGTEASLSSWLATELHPSLFRYTSAFVRYLMRKICIGHIALGADVAFYLEKRG